MWYCKRQQQRSALIDLVCAMKHDYKKYQDYLKSKKWRSKRKMMLIITENKCQHCGSDKNLQIHHRHYKTLFKEKYKDLMVLCENCHSREHKITG